MSLLDGVQQAPEDGSLGGGGGLRVSLMGDAGVTERPADIKRGLMVLALVLVVETLVLGGAYLLLASLSGGRTGEREAIRAEIARLEAEAVSARADVERAADYNAQTVAATAALDDHVRWTNLFAFLEERTKPDIKYASFAGDADTGTVTVDAIASNYRSVAEQIVVFREDPLVDDVRSNSASARVTPDGEVQGVAFTMTIKLKKELWTTFAGTAAQAQAGGGAAAAVAAASPATVADCGPSTGPTDAAARCFASNFRTCTPARVSAPAALGRATYEIKGQSDSGCTVEITYAQDIALSEFAGKSYACPYDVAADFWGQASQPLGEKCTGTLMDALATPQT